MNVIETHIEKILVDYTQGEHYELLKKAKELYTELTGKLDEESDEYELRMNSFNDWYIFNFKRENDRAIIDDYIFDHKIDDELAKAFHNINYSLFSFLKTNMKKQIVLKDVLHDKKIALSKEVQHFGMVQDDLFVGRSIEYKGETYLLRGMCPLPGNVLSALKKQAKKIRKLNSHEEEEKFLLELERLKIKSLNYSHIDANKIFVFK
ncbi:MAG: hypothetical protein KC478_17355 [Bacteriovoracaceae bacterium]|nr:hypothetical protein [Bacteriovoracaceae bacterium]